jgi:hypothetical protein
VFRFQLAMLVVPLAAVLMTLATRRSMDSTLRMLVFFWLGGLLWLSVRLRTWALFVRPSTIIGILGLAIAFRGPDAHGMIDKVLSAALETALFSFMVAGFWLRWRDWKTRAKH